MKPAHLYVEADHDGAGRMAARLVDEAIHIKPEIVLALPTGTTPVPMYRQLAVLHAERRTDWSRVTTFNLDEYVGVGPDHPESYTHYMATQLFSRVNLPPERRHLPDGLAPEPAAEARRYEAAIDDAGGIDLAVLGVGVNGHLGFNEPGVELSGPAHVATLAQETWRRNFPNLAAAAARMGDTDLAARPHRRAYTMGIGTILQARRIILLATGDAKREIVRRALHGPVTTQNPASLLQLHTQVIVVLDRAAAGGAAG